MAISVSKIRKKMLISEKDHKTYITHWLVYRRWLCQMQDSGNTQQSLGKEKLRW